MSKSIPKPIKKADWFLTNGALILQDRGKTYDKDDKQEERSMEKIIRIFNVITGHDLTETEGWMFMACVKQIRAFAKKGYHEDSWQDFVNYAALGAESAANVNEAPSPQEVLDFIKESEKKDPTASGNKNPKGLLDSVAFKMYQQAQRVRGFVSVPTWDDLDHGDQEHWRELAARPNRRRTSKLA